VLVTLGPVLGPVADADALALVVLDLDEPRGPGGPSKMMLMALMGEILSGRKPGR
jgi:hypothetical protein